MADIADDVANAMLNAIEATVGPAALLRIFVGAKPANCGAADPATKLAEMTLPSDYFADAASRSKALLGTWQDTSADNSGNAGCWRLYTSGGTCKMQGTVTATGGGGELTLAAIAITATQPVLVTSFALGM